MIEQENPLESMDIQHIKFADGKEIVAYINKVEGAYIIVERPMTINLVQTSNGFDTYFFTKYMPFSKYNLVRLNSLNVVAASEVNEEIKERYIKAVIRTHNGDEDDTDDDGLSENDMNLNSMESPSKKYH